MVSPAPHTDSVLGNGVTARRWAALLGSLGHRVRIARQYEPGDHTALVALHAGKSAGAVRAFASAHPAAPIVLALTGTDLYPDLAATGVDPAVLRLATRLVVLQRHGTRQVAAVDGELASRVRVIVQSVEPPAPAPRRQDVFEVVVLAHLRPVKDPLLAAAAAGLLPESSRLVVSHAGAGLDPALAARAQRESAVSPRYDWLGELARPDALALLARSRALVLTSRHEGGANVVSEALATGVPVLATAIPGSTGLLGDGYPGCFPVGDPAALAKLLLAFERDENGLRTRLGEWCAALRPMVDPQAERRAWAALLAELGLSQPGR
ncbi:TIGR04348 family glycosyltransferase [Amycolatopsis suaedae]|uniref:TIGR04348 family glycosyltransferase n=1 Tax=Amycolatopsis suaedae TaxID=2510978 RepID=A0A4Q7J5L0_9PSEU|nr:TIGR04348 family glycosyltransferase [Amycolatopsis suaedae]